MNPRIGAMTGNLKLATAFVLLGGMLTSCVLPQPRAELGNLSELRSDEVVIVGRVDLVPKLAEGEQKLEALGTGDAVNKVYLLTNEHYRVFEQEPRMSDYEGYIPAPLGKNFFVRSSAKPFYILGGQLRLTARGDDMSSAYFPGGMKVSVKPGDKAVYIGAIQYYRDEFFEVSKIVIVDDYDRANAEFKRTYGAKYSLRKALVTPVK